MCLWTGCDVSGDACHAFKMGAAAGTQQNGHVRLCRYVTTPSQSQGRLNPGGMTHFASQEMLGEAERCCHKVRFETRRFVKMRLRPGLHPGPAGGAYSAP